MNFSLEQPQALKMDRPASISFTGESVKETRMVSPIPSHKSVPMPIADFKVPELPLPASVTPIWRGY